MEKTEGPGDLGIVSPSNYRPINLSSAYIKEDGRPETGDDALIRN